MITKLNYKDKTIKSYAIRKFTPRECFRLMGIWDAVIDVMQSTCKRIKNVFNTITGKKEPQTVDEMVVSASQQYKQAGNSIVVDVLTAIYERLWFADKVKEVRKDGYQFDLFDDCPEFTNTEDGEATPHVTDLNHIHNIITTFSGYDSQALAAMQLAQRHPGWKWNLTAWCEIDKYACQMHDLIFPEYKDRNVGDITKVDWTQFKDQEIDLFTYSSPCQDISQAGRQIGLTEGSGTRSSLLWNVVDAIEALHPKFLLQENVAALVSKKFIPDFKKWLDKLDELGYVSYWARLNAKDYGVPQNRDRVFCVSIRKDIRLQYRFPEPVPLEKRLEDILEEDVDERFFLRDDAVAKFLRANDQDHCVFVQFPIAPTHADAMFVKTWLHRWLNANDAWNLTPTQLERAVIHARDTVFPEDWHQSPEMQDETFLSEYTYNLNRHKVE